ncbi:MAG TPA: MOSC domain-containing protein [Gaiellaceae bacterium]|nr:MOSC domain-containing protein [Gaiellaceae bacterium]
MRVESVNVAHDPRVVQVGAREVSTGIAKVPVPSAWVGALGVGGDVVADQDAHGGPDQAVYLYSREDYGWWDRELGERHAPGAFGENLTVTSYGGGDVRVGDRFRAGGAVLEATAPRIPCGVFATHVRRDGWVKRFADSRRTGVYARVLEEGEVAAGDAWEPLGGGEGNPTIAELVAVWYEKATPAEELERILRAPVAERMRVALERRLASARAA